MRFNRVSVCLLLLVLLAFPTTSFSDNPDWYERYLFRAACAKQTRCITLAEIPQQIQDYVNDFYQPIRSASSVNDDVFVFISGDTSTNAWTLKHYAVLTVGLVAKGFADTFTKDEMAFVAAHELAHIELRHYERKQNELAKIMGIALILTILGQGYYNPLNDPYFVTAARIGLAAYSRELETEADLRGVQLMRSAGFDPKASVSALIKIAPIGVVGAGDLFDNHPSTLQRINRLQSELGL